MSRSVVIKDRRFWWRGSDGRLTPVTVSERILNTIRQANAFQTNREQGNA